jgi:transcriptional regulator with GAF, ATPase, and Fis domain
MRPDAAHAGTLPIGDSPRAVMLDRFSLAVVDGPDRGMTARSEGVELSIGTAEGSGLELHDASVSRHHCSVVSTPQGFLVRDLGSRNGTRVNGCRIERGYLDDGAMLEVGRTKVKFLPLDEWISEPLSPSDRLGRLLGRSSAMRRIFAIVPNLAASESTVLLEGETGTGKGVLAEAIHEASRRASGPFVVLDCASIPRTLIESELFGHLKGSFTGAHADRAGAFEQAEGGTIFLDEIGELPLDLQPKLLRALEERQVKRIGGRAPVKLDVRVIAATNRDLRAEVNRGAFRSDLYYRLDVFKLELPPLRERRDDIPLLVEAFYERLRPGRPVPQELVEACVRQAWPGNVRELRSGVERWVLLDEIGAAEAWRQGETVPPPAASDVEFDPSVPFRVAKEQAMARWEKVYLEHLMAHAAGNLSQAARVVGTDRSHLRELLRKHGLRVAG